MILEDFEEFLDENGIEYYESGVSLCLKHCPACGSNNFKVLLRVHGIDDTDQYFGRCQRGSCNEGYSSIKYLLRMGVSRNDVFDIHGLDPVTVFNSMADSAPREKKSKLDDFGLGEAQVDDLRMVEAVISMIGFNSPRDWPNHPSAKYALMRGIDESFMKALPDSVFVDFNANSVVFVCRNDKGEPIGYQQRFVNPSNPKMKTQTMSGFVKTEHILKYPNNGDIVICEGPFTAVSAWHYGFYAICTFGAAISKSQMEQIVAIAHENNKKIGVAIENDKAGNQCFRSARSHLYWINEEIFKVKPNSGKDLNDAWQDKTGYTIEKDEDWQGPALPDVDFFANES